MGKSDDITNELESYGVWVKQPSDSETQSPAEENSFDLPDVEEPAEGFENSDFSDMFKDDFGNDDDTTLSTDELANITGTADVSIEQVDAPDTSDDASDFAMPDTAVNTATEDITFEPLNADETISDNTQEVTFDEPAEEVSETPAEDVTDSFGSDEEVSLDDFMDGGFSDDSVASGNNGYEPGKEPKNEVPVSTETEELSLDDFIDGDFESAPEEAKTEEIDEDVQPLDMDLTFDDSADAIETIENFDITEAISDEDDAEENTETVDTNETEEVSIDDFDTGFSAEEPAASEEVSSASSENLNTEDVDLSDFGIDSSAEETPIVQDVEESKKDDEIVDFDLSVGNEDTSSAPVVNEVKEEKTEEADPAKTPVETSLLQQIVADLSGLKDEINQLKSNLAEIKAAERGQTEATPSDNLAGIVDTEPADEGGFFSDDDSDDTIALSGDELSNIMNSADFSTAEGDVEPDVVEESEPEIEETAIDESEIAEESATEEPVIEESVAAEEPVIEETDDMPVTDAVEQLSEKETDDFSAQIGLSDDDTLIQESIQDTIQEDISDDMNEDLSFDYENENLEEPVIDNISIDEETDDLPDEISIPKSDDILVESNDSDFMDTVRDNTETEIESIEEETEFDTTEEVIEESESFTTEDSSEDFQINEPVSEEELSFTSTDDFSEEPVIEDTATESAADETSFPTTDDFASETTEASEPVLDNEPVAADDDIPTVDKLINDDELENPDVIDEPVTEEAEASISDDETSENESFDEIDNLNNDLSSGNLNYLTTEEKESSDMSDSIIESTDNGGLNSDLKQDIKSVLLYMDQLLENLPEEKIVEFAKSEEFTTYKKLFNELGLS